MFPLSLQKQYNKVTSCVKEIQRRNRKRLRLAHGEKVSRNVVQGATFTFILYVHTFDTSGISYRLHSPGLTEEGMQIFAGKTPLQNNAAMLLLYL